MTQEAQVVNWNCPCGNLIKFHGFTEAPQEQQSCDRRTWGKPWVSLTDEERSKIWGELPQTTNEERDACIFAECIELYLKEKNT